MRKITQEASQCFKNWQVYKCSNTCIDWGLSNLNPRLYFFLHNNCIAEYATKKGELVLMDAGWRTNVTKERLNGILSEFGLGSIHQKNGTRFFTNKDGVTSKRDGTLTLKVD